MKIAGN